MTSIDENTRNFLREIGKKGGNTTAARHGAVHFAKIGKLSKRKKKSNQLDT